MAGAGSLGAADITTTPAITATQARAPSTDTARLIAARGVQVSRSGSRGAQQPNDSLPRVSAEDMRKLEQARAALNSAAGNRASYLAANRWSLPLNRISITASFGAGGGLWAGGHTGLDFDGVTGDPIRSITGGVVSSSGWDGSYGIKTVVTDADGTEFWYCHQLTTAVAAGERVSSGQVIGAVGSTGNVTGSHLHLETRPPGSGPVDPYVLLRSRGLVL